MTTPTARLWRRPALVATAVALLTLGLFWPATQLGFVEFDDDEYVTDNAHVRDGLSWANLRYAATATDVTNWHPLTWLSYMLDAQLFGIDPRAFHATNVVLHAANAALLLWLLLRATGALVPSAAVAVLFAVHPLNVESVAWVAERKNVLSTFFWLLTMLAYVRWSRTAFPVHYALVAGGLTLSLLTKPMAVTAPFVLLLLDYWPLDRARLGWRRLVLEKLPLFALVAAVSWVTVAVQGAAGAMVGGPGFSLAARVQNAIWSYVAYLQKAVWPARLAAFYPHPEGSLPLSQVGAAAVALVSVSVVLFVWRDRLRPQLVGWLWYVGTLVPVIGLVQVGSQALADRYAYVPLIGIFVAVVWGASSAIQQRPKRAEFVAALFLAFAVAFAMKSWRQTTVWRDTETLFRHTTRLEPGAWVAHYNLGNVYERQGRHDDAIARFRTVIRQEPGFARGHSGLGTALLGKGLHGEAVAPLERAVELRPDLIEAYNNLGISYVGLDQRDKAADILRKATEVDPTFVEARINLAMVLRILGRLDDSLAEASHAVDTRPDVPQARLQRALTLVALGRREPARADLVVLETTAPEMAATLRLAIDAR